MRFGYKQLKDQLETSFMNRMKRLTGREDTSGGCCTLRIWHCKSAKRTTAKDTLTLTLDKALNNCVG